MKYITILITTVLLFLVGFGFGENIDNTGDNTTGQQHIVELPFLGDINLYALSIPVLTIIAGLLDGFNPCALFILLFLLSILLGSGDKKKVIILGSTFIIASGIAYLGILSFLLFTVQSIPQHLRGTFQIMVGVLGIIFGISSLIKAFTEKTGCSVMGEKRRKFFFDKIQKVIQQKSMILSIIGISLIAFIVNFLEMFCTVGIPITYVTILEAQGFGLITNILFLLGYVFFFLLDHFIIFGFAVATFSLIGISNKHKIWINILGGLLMLGLGITIIIKPELLMF
ncbi:hypothetical protein [Candidatus Absconditicoccus praedator]|uniref:hypothetical protein n=1 Tax=Candidatus Absconditicoccus praedator TaxID=2735562 RepID=UPI001E313979|nr:hypothetical protein [Candidatus Absconditicoccus praedator]UFX83016.1 hypothetical protein HLG78_02675 [Candidatus Absconditicoccus praedator]